LPTLLAKFIGAVTTVLAVENDVLTTFFVVFVTECVTELIGLKIDLAWHAAGRTSARSITTTTAVKTRTILEIMIITFVDTLPKLMCCQTKTSVT
jgi:hypothetical protein